MRLQVLTQGRKFAVHLCLHRSLQGMCQQLSKAVEQLCDMVRPVQNKSFGLGVHFSKNVKDTLGGRRDKEDGKKE